MKKIIQMKTWVLNTKCLDHNVGQVSWKMINKKKMGLVSQVILKKKKLSQMKMIHAETMQVVVVKQMYHVN